MTYTYLTYDLHKKLVICLSFLKIFIKKIYFMHRQINFIYYSYIHTTNNLQLY